jgi:hypothetical protein
MIIGKTFAWGHIGKTAGETTAELFRIFPALIQRADRIGTQEQHTSFLERLTEVRGKELVLNIRRLPSWMLSYHMHRSNWGVYPTFEPQPMKSPLDMAKDGIADEHLAHFTGHGEFEIDRWLRVEHLAEDFLDLISRYTEVSPAERRQVIRFPGINRATYDRQIEHWFSSAHIELMYRSNPVWAAVEEMVYGGADGRTGGPSARVTGDSSSDDAAPLRARLTARLRATR